MLPNSAQSSPARDVGVGRDDRATPAGRRRGSSSAAPAADRLERPPIDVGDEVAEAIDAQHFAVDRRRRRRRGCGSSSRCSRAGRPAERRELDALREPGRRRREAIAPLERPADGRPRVAPLGQLDDALRRLLVEHRRQHAVVGRDEPVVAGFRRDAPPRRADARDRRRRGRSCRRESTDTRPRARARRPSTSCGGMSCEMSTSVASGQMPSTTPFIVPA